MALSQTSRNTMRPNDFVHLHVHSDFSLLDGNCQLSRLVDRCGELGMDAMALTDHGNLFGSINFYKAARKAGIKPILGMEGYLANGSRFDRKRVAKGKNTYHITLLVKNQIGFRNLIKLSSAAYLEGFYYRPRMDKELLRKWGEGLICLSGCLSGELIQTIRREGMEAGKRVIAEYKEIFGPENYYIELMHNGLEIQFEANRALIELSQSTNTPIAATNDVHYIKPEDHEAQDVLLCIGTGKLKSEEKRFKMDSRSLYLRDAGEMGELFKSTPAALANTREIADRCELEIPFNQRFLPRFETPGGEDSQAYFERLCREGIERLYPEPTEEVWKRLQYETDTIVSMGFVDYFLIVADFIRYAEENGVPVGPGRGSAAGSIVAYALGITKLDPLAYDLLFERFLNAERISMPDIDIDFCKDGRQKVIEYVEEKYGHDNVAQIITFGTMAAKGVLRDVGRVLDIPLSEIDTIAKKIPAGPGVTLNKSLAQDVELRELSQSTPERKELFDTALKIEGCARHASVHAAGVVITDAPLTERVPLYKNGDTVTTQWTMDVIEEVGLLKMDFLGLRTLTIIDKARKNVQQTKGLEIDPNALPLDDPATFELFQRADTIGVFQLESGGMRELLKKLRPDSFEDIIAVLALYRPGPLGSGMHEMYCKRKHGEEKVIHLHPILEPILEESYGVILYQEQVMRIAAALAGFSLNEADSLRKAMGKKKPEILAKFKKKFVDGAARKDVSNAVATEVWEQIEYFAGYGFNKSHSAAYALVTYQTAWFKANHPIEYMAALLSCEMISIDKTVEYIEACREMGIEILPPDVNHSYFEFAVEGDAIRYALGAIRGAGQSAIELLTQERDEEGKPFTSLFDVTERIDTRVLNKGVLESLIHAGALDSLPGNRAQKLAALEDALRQGHDVQEDKRSGQMSLFGDDDLQDASGGGEVSQLPDKPELPEAERLQLEKAALGFYISGHPLNEYRQEITRFATHETAALERCVDNSEVIVGGIIRSVRLMLTRRGKFEGKRMAFVKLEDFSGTVDCVIFASVYGDVADQIKADRILFFRGEVDKGRSAPSVKVNEVIPLSDARRTLTRRLTIKVSCKDEDSEHLDLTLASLKRMLKENPGRVPVAFELDRPRFGKIILRAGNEYAVDPNERFFGQLESLLGPQSVACN